MYIYAKSYAKEWAVYYSNPLKIKKLETFYISISKRNVKVNSGIVLHYDSIQQLK